MCLGSPLVPFTLFFGYGSPYKVTNPKKGALIKIWLLGYQGVYHGQSVPRQASSRRGVGFEVAADEALNPEP